MRRPCFVEDDGLASIAEMQPGFSGFNNNNPYYYSHQNQPFLRRRNSLKNISSLSPSLSSSSTVVSSTRFEEPQSPHFLEACFLCKKPLGGNRDIFMYRGDTPFCSEECRKEQIEIDEAKDKKWNLKALRSKKESAKSGSSSPSSPSKSQNYPLRTGTVAAA